MIKTFINSNGEEIKTTIPFSQVTPITSKVINGMFYYRKYSKLVIWLNAFISRRNADLLRYL